MNKAQVVCTPLSLRYDRICTAFGRLSIAGAGCHQCFVS